MTMSQKPCTVSPVLSLHNQPRKGMTLTAIVSVLPGVDMCCKIP